MDIFFELCWNSSTGDILDGEHSDDLVVFVGYYQTINAFMEDSVEGVTNSNVISDSNRILVIDFVDEH